MILDVVDDWQIIIKRSGALTNLEIFDVIVKILLVIKQPHTKLRVWNPSQSIDISYIK